MTKERPQAFKDAQNQAANSKTRRAPTGFNVGMGRMRGAETIKRKTRAEREAQETMNERMTRLTMELGTKEIIPKLVAEVRDNIDKNGPYNFDDTSFLSAYTMGLGTAARVVSEYFAAGTVGFIPGEGFATNEEKG